MKIINYSSMIFLMCAVLLYADQHEPKKLARHELFWEHNDVWYSFESWSQTYYQPSAKKAIEHIQNKKYHSMLDVGCGACPEYFGFKQNRHEIDYRGVDVTPRILDYALLKKLPVSFGHAEDLPCADSSFDIVYARHLFEHLKYYKKALAQMIRIAKQEVLIVFFLAPNDAQDNLDYKLQDKTALFNNRYNKQKLEQYVMSFEKVDRIEWDILKATTPSGDEALMHIYLKQPIENPS